MAAWRFASCRPERGHRLGRNGARGRPTGEMRMPTQSPTTALPWTFHRQRCRFFDPSVCHESKLAAAVCLPKLLLCLAHHVSILNEYSLRFSFSAACIGRVLSRRQQRGAPTRCAPYLPRWFRDKRMTCKFAGGTGTSVAAATVAAELRGPLVREHFALTMHHIWVRPADVFSPCGRC